MTPQLRLKTDDLDRHDGDVEIVFPPDDDHEWQIVSADVKIHLPTPRVELSFTRVSVLWMLKE